jgi:hypothetical protein
MYWALIETAREEQQRAASHTEFGEQIGDNPPSGTSKSAAEPQKTALSNEPKIGGSELGELRVLKTE